MNNYILSGDESKGQRGKKFFPFRTAAEYYRYMGWTGVIPVTRRGTKAPLVKGVTGHNGIDATDEELLKLIREFPTANIGIRLPWDVIGIDVDAYDGRAGSKTIHEIAKMIGCNLPPTWRSTSRAPEDKVSGIYLYYSHRENNQVWLTDLGPGSGVEIAQWHHRFATVAPSIHNTTGRQYRWWYGDKLVKPPIITALTRLPVEWRDFLLSEREFSVTDKVQLENVASWYAGLSQGEMCKYMKAMAVKQRSNVRLAADFGGLHDAMCVAVTHLCRNAAEGHTGIDMALYFIESEVIRARRRRNLGLEWTNVVNTAMARAAAGKQEEIDVCGMRHIPREGKDDWRKMS
jgi:hypothetical protein